MFATIGRSWQFAKIAYGIVWDFKKLIIFPLLSTIAAAAVIASFVAPLWLSGTLESWLGSIDPESTTPASTGDQVAMYVTLFLFYFCNYFVIVFFNAGLTACAMKVVNGEAPTIGYGLRMAGTRLPQILGWAFVSALVGVLLKVIENANEKAGQFVAAILGSAWTALTFFVVPVVVMDGVGPVTAIKRSIGTLKSTWGEALVGNFSMGILAFVVMLPVILGFGVLVVLVMPAVGVVGGVIAAATAVFLIMIGVAAISTADIVFKVLLYNYATGRSVPANVDQSLFQDAFRSRQTS